MKNKKPWEPNWKRGEAIGGGGQGDAFFITKKENKTKAVLKVLKNQKNSRNRARMFREVSTLKSLELVCNVPKVFETNVELYNDTEEFLFFIMEYIEGDTLKSYVERSNSLPFEEAFRITNELINFFEKAHREGVYHRDIKPENIIVAKNKEVYIIDFGLSFNINEDELTITEVGERIDNRFLSLPERRLETGDLRDPRSDLTGICGIFFYCLTGKPPIDLSDSDGLPPHRRIDLNSLIKDESLSLRTLSFFDTGFSQKIDSRFQSLNELNNIFSYIVSDKDLMDVDPLDAASISDNNFKKLDRKTLISSMTLSTVNIIHELQTYWKNLGGKFSNKGFKITCSGSIKNLNISYPSDYDLVDQTVMNLSRHVYSNIHSVSQYIFISKNDKCELYLISGIVDRSSIKKQSELELIFSFDPQDNLDTYLKLVVEDAKRKLTRSINDLEKYILPNS